MDRLLTRRETSAIKTKAVILMLKQTKRLNQLLRDGATLFSIA